MRYRDALRYLYRLTNYEQRGFAAYAPAFYNLERLERLLKLLGNPHHQYQVIHIAGTKGKGSTGAMAASVLQAAGYQTGLYTSPHLHTFRERIQVDGRMIAETDVIRLVQSIQPLVSQVPELTTFEVMTALAFEWFAEQSIDWAVVEVGLGGRLDATNVVQPVVAVITSISLDHTAVLGDTVAQIALEKAGIIKLGVPVVSAPQVSEALAVIEATCKAKGVPLTYVGRDWTWEPQQATLAGQEFSVHHGASSLHRLRIPLLGEYQLANATTALAALDKVTEAGWAVPEEAMRQGLASVQWPGRLEILAQKPWLVADCAHNGDSASKLIAAVKALLGYQRLIVILGVSADHATPALFQALLSNAALSIATRSRHPRAADPVWIQSRAGRMGFSMQVCPRVPQAVEKARAEAGPADLILCTGSVFVAAETRAYWLDRMGVDRPPSDPL